MRLFRILIFISAMASQSLVSFSQNNKTRFIEIYQKILSVKCSLGGCHDGSFEPNYTSFSSSYNTLVNHPAIKKDKENKYSIRVVPYNVNKSILYQRVTNCCFVDKNDRMPFYDKDGLSSKEVEMIKSWIINGATMK